MKEELGDSPSIERPVSHYFSFNNKSNVNLFQEEVMKSSLNDVKFKCSIHTKKKFWCELEITSNIEWHIIADFIRYFWNLSSKCQGMYEYWETIPINSKVLTLLSNIKE